MTERPRVVILGAGITGLTAAHEARKLGAEVIVLEEAARAGGKVRTEPRQGAIIESGPDSFVTSKPQALELVRELGLEGELMPTGPSRGAVRVYSRGRLRPLPEGLSLALPTRFWPLMRSDLLSWPAKLRLGIYPFIAPGLGADESLGSFFRRRLGAEAVENLIAPLLAGIYAGDCEELSLRSTFPQFREMERQGGLLRAAWKAAQRKPSNGALPLFMTLRPGLSSLTDALAAKLPAGALRLGAAARRLTRSGAGWEIRSRDAAFSADAVIAAIPAGALALLAGGFDPELSGVLREIPMASTAAVTLLYEKKYFPAERAGFGFVVPRAAARRLTAATFVSTKWPGRAPKGTVLIRCFIGAAGREAEGDDEALAMCAQEELGEILRLGRTRPLWAQVARWPRANPQYTVGHGGRLCRIEARLKAHPGFFVAGASYHGIGLPDCIQSGRRAAAAALSGRQARSAIAQGATA